MDKKPIDKSKYYTPRPSRKGQPVQNLGGAAREIVKAFSKKSKYFNTKK